MKSGNPGDYGSGFFGHAVNTGTYLVDHPEFGWLAFGGNLDWKEDWVTVKPLDSARSRFYLAPLGLWLTLDAGMLNEVRYNSITQEVELLIDGSEYTPRARLNVSQPAKIKGVGTIAPVEDLRSERGAYVIPLDQGREKVRLSSR